MFDVRDWTPEEVTSEELSIWNWSAVVRNKCLYVNRITFKKKKKKKRGSANGDMRRKPHFQFPRTHGKHRLVDVVAVPPRTKRERRARPFPRVQRSHQESQAKLTGVVCVGTITMADESKHGAMPRYMHDPKPKVQKLCTLSLVRDRKSVV